jgi:hypothetical protein
MVDPVKCKLSFSPKRHKEAKIFENEMKGYIGPFSRDPVFSKGDVIF